jgi:HEAT repeat protein
VGRLLLAEARPADEALINRLFAVYSREVEALQPELVSPDVTRRRVAVGALRRYGPLARKEYERALGDADRQVRGAAARGLAGAEGLGVLDAARRQLRPEAEPGAQRPWLEAAAREAGGAALLVAVAEDARQAPALRGEAVALLAEVGEGAAARFQRLVPFLQGPEPRVRAGAVRGLAALPRMPEVAEVLGAALGDSAPEVQAEAIPALAAQRQMTHADAVAGLLASEAPGVREAAARALEYLGRASHVPALAARLQGDPVAAVRVAAARTLGILGGPRALPALTQASRRDADSHVQHVAREALQRLGFLH